MMREKIRKYFDNRSDILLVFLFGSHAGGRNRPGSDVDIAVLGMRSLTIEEILDAKLHLGTDLGCEVDLIDLAASHGAILQEVVCRGELLINRDSEAYARLIKRMWFEKEDDGRFIQKTFQERLRICRR